MVGVSPFIVLQMRTKTLEKQKPTPKSS